MTPRSALVVHLTACAVGSPLLQAQTPGSLDVSFGGTGIVATAIGPSPWNDICWGPVAVQADRKIVVGGRSRPMTSGNSSWAVVRYTEDGSPDPAFGQGGIVKLLPSSSSDVRDLGIDGAGRIVLFGWDATSNWSLVRLLPDGSLDTTFGGGLVETSFGRADAPARALVVQADGKILAAGRYLGTPAPQIALARYLANGKLDTSFGKKGLALVSTPRGTSPDVRRGAIAVQPGGRIVLGGSLHSSNGSNSDWTVFGVTAGGSSLDASFGSGGLASLPQSIGTSRHLWSVRVQPNGQIVTCGSIGFGSGTSDMAVVRFLSHGAIDTNFGTAGLALAGAGIIGPFVSAQGMACAVQADGAIVVGGYGFVTLGQELGSVRMAVCRLLANGLPDPSFGVNGVGQVFVPGVEAFETAYGMALAPDGKIVLAGTHGSGSQGLAAEYRFAAARWNG